MEQQKKAKRPGRPKLPKAEAKGKIVPVRLDAEDLALTLAAAKNSNQALSEWIRTTLRNTAEGQMYERTLHEAMKIVLSQGPDLGATTSELSDEIERRRLYTRKDGATAKAKQINARAKKYPNLFKIDSSGSVRLNKQY